MKTIASVIGAVAFVGGVGVSVAIAAGPTAPAAAPTPAAAPAATPAAMPAAVTELKGIKWGPAPPGLPAGSQAAVMAGDPSAKGFVSIRAKLPPGYKVPPHFHPTDEHTSDPFGINRQRRLATTFALGT